MCEMPHSVKTVLSHREIKNNKIKNNVSTKDRDVFFYI